MSCLAWSSSQFSVWSANQDILSSNIFIRAPSGAKISRLLQFIHWSLRQISNDVGPIDEYCLKYQDKCLQLELLCDEVEVNNHGVIQLQLEKKISGIQSPINLDYDFDKEFINTNLKFQINTLSTDKLLSIMEYNVPMNITLSKLKKIACRLLNDYENQRSNNLCSVKDHLLDDFLAFNIMGKSEPIFLRDESCDDLTLKDLLGIDFTPMSSSYCCLLFKVKHVYDQELVDGIIVEFVSDANVCVKSVKLGKHTTIIQIKEFICSVYDHPSILQPDDVKLVYKGQLLHDNNYAGSPSKVLEYISEPNCKMHVNIKQKDPVTELESWFKNFKISSSLVLGGEEGVDNKDGELDMKISIIDTIDESSSHNIFDSKNSQTFEGLKYITENQISIKRTGQLYERVLINEDTCFLPTYSFDTIKHKLIINENILTISGDDYYLKDNKILCKPNLVTQIEHLLDKTLQKKKLPIDGIDSLGLEEVPKFNNLDNVNEERYFYEENTRIGILKQWIQTLLKTIYLMIRNSVLPLIILLQISSFISTFYCCVCVTFILLRSLWITNEIWVMWGELLNKNGKMTDRDIKNIEIYISRLSTSQFPNDKKFYYKFIDDALIKEELMSKLTNDLKLKETIFEEYKFKSDESLEVVIPLLLERGVSVQFENSDGTLLYKVFENFFNDIKEYIHSNQQVQLSESRKLFLTQLKQFAYENMSLPRHKTIIRWIQVNKPWEPIINFYNGGLMRLIVPLPQKDGILLSIFKNIILFFLILWPKFQRQFEELMAERDIRSTNEETHNNNEQEYHELSNEEQVILQDNNILEPLDVMDDGDTQDITEPRVNLATGVELHEESL